MSNLRLSPDEPVGSNDVQCRLWVGNLDSRITEFTLLKLLQKFGSLKKFDFLYHKSGPDQGKPRGYCFVTYNTKQECKAAEKGLNGKLALSRKLVVKPAHPSPEEEGPGLQQRRTASMTNTPSAQPSSLSTETKIQAIEAKLRMMERGGPAKMVPHPSVRCHSQSTFNTQSTITRASTRPATNSTATSSLISRMYQKEHPTAAPPRKEFQYKSGSLDKKHSR